MKLVKALLIGLAFGVAATLPCVLSYSIVTRILESPAATANTVKLPGIKRALCLLEDKSSGLVVVSIENELLDNPVWLTTTKVRVRDKPTVMGKQISREPVGTPVHIDRSWEKIEADGFVWIKRTDGNFMALGEIGGENYLGHTGRVTACNILNKLH